MKQNREDIEAFWNGLYSWPKFEAENGLPHIHEFPVFICKLLNIEAAI